MPDLGFNSAGQCFPRYEYQTASGVQSQLGEAATAKRIDNIADSALAAYRSHYGDSSITKDDIFNYVYGVFSAPEYRERFRVDLTRELPRLPFAADFHAFARAGQALTELHLGYGRCDQYPLDVVFGGEGEARPQHFRLGARAMRFVDAERSILRVNDFISLAGVPAGAHEYRVNGRTPLEWFIDRYKVKQDKRSGIVNDPNGWFEDPRDLIPAVRRIVHLSVETVRIVDGLPALGPLDSGKGRVPS